MPKSRYYLARDIVRLAETAIALSEINLDIKTQSKRKYYSKLINFVNDRARFTRSPNLPDHFSVINDYRFFINNYEKHLKTLEEKGKNVKVKATTSFINTLIRCTDIIITPIIVKEERKVTTNDLVDRWTIVFRRQNDLKGYNTTAEIIHKTTGKEINLIIKQKEYKGYVYRQHDYFIAVIKEDDIDIVIRINEELQQDGIFFTGTFMGKLPVYNQYPTGEIFMIRESRRGKA